MITSSQRQYVLSLWEGLQKSLSDIPIAQAASISKDAQKIFSAMARHPEFDFSSLREKVNAYIKKAEELQDLKGRLNSSMTSDEQAKRMVSLETELKSAQDLEDEGVRHHLLLQAKLVRVEEKLQALMAEKEELGSLLQLSRATLDELRQDTTKVQDEMALVEVMPICSEEDSNSLQRLQSSLEKDHTELKNFKWKP